MNDYEAMFLVNSKLDEKSTEAVCEQIKEAITKNKGDIVSAQVWAEKRKLTFPIKKNTDATYYLVNFKLKASLLDTIKGAYRLNEDILRMLILKLEEVKSPGRT